MSYHNCHINHNGQIKCWGYNTFGELGLGDTVNRGDTSNGIGSFLPFVNVGNGLIVNKVSTGFDHTCVLFTSNQVKCWGSNGSGQLGLGISDSMTGSTSTTTPDKYSPLNLGTISYPIDVLCGRRYTCILFDNNQIKCFGFYLDGELGYEGISTHIGLSANDMGDNLPFVSLGSGVQVQSIHIGGGSRHNCIIVSNSQLMKCYGYNNLGQLGYGDTTSRGFATGTMGDNLQTIDLGDEDRVKQIALADSFTCALRIDDVLLCWGLNNNGQLGIGSTVSPITAMGSSLTPTLYDSVKKIKQISAGNNHFCLLHDDNLTVQCIGTNNYGQLGLGDVSDRGVSPTKLFPNLPSIDLGTGSLQISNLKLFYAVTCVIFVDNNLKCFGDGFNGKLASGNSDTIGDAPSDMGSNLPFVNLFPPTFAPTFVPTTVPTLNPTRAPSNIPTRHPTTSPTKSCDYQSAKLCKYDMRCIWKKINDAKQCVVFDCATLNKGKCGKQSKRCKWNKKTSTCNLKIK